MNYVKMHGPSISDPAKIVNRDVPECDVHAYMNAGYKRGSLPDEKTPEVEAAPEPVEVEKPTKARPKKAKK